MIRRNIKSINEASNRNARMNAESISLCLFDLIEEINKNGIEIVQKGLYASCSGESFDAAGISDSSVIVNEGDENDQYFCEGEDIAKIISIKLRNSTNGHNKVDVNIANNSPESTSFLINIQNDEWAMSFVLDFESNGNGSFSFSAYQYDCRPNALKSWSIYHMFNEVPYYC